MSSMSSARSGCPGAPPTRRGTACCRGHPVEVGARDREDDLRVGRQADGDYLVQQEILAVAEAAYPSWQTRPPPLGAAFRHRIPPAEILRNGHDHRFIEDLPHGGRPLWRLHPCEHRLDVGVPLPA
jgi:hypothetical protein